MHRDASQSPARVLAPLALAICAVAFFYVIFSSGSGDNGSTTSTQQTTSSKRTQGARSTRPRPSTYTVKTGDTLGGIAAKTGVSVDKLQELNPGLDPQGLVSGQKVKLRE
jgi:LysM repeat protein